MNWASLLKAVPALITLVSNLFANRKGPARRAEDILGKPGDKTDAQKAKDAADAAADAKYN